MIQMSPRSNDKCPYERKTEGDMRGKKREGGHVKTEVELGATQSQAKEPLEPPDAGRGKE